MPICVLVTVGNRSETCAYWEKKLTAHDEDIRLIFEALKQLLNPPQEPRKRIGFKPDD